MGKLVLFTFLALMGKFAYGKALTGDGLEGLTNINEIVSGFGTPQKPCLNRVYERIFVEEGFDVPHDVEDFKLLVEDGVFSTSFVVEGEHYVEIEGFIKHGDSSEALEVNMERAEVVNWPVNFDIKNSVRVLPILDVDNKITGLMLKLKF